jgi:thiosulfate reductase cytochrome b subunit
MATVHGGEKNGTGGETAVREVIYRHALAVRITHWINFVCVTIMLMSGLQIFNAHPRLYLGQAGADADPAFIQIYAVQAADGSKLGRMDIAGVTLPTTGVLGVTRMGGKDVERAWPPWMTLPAVQDLAGGRRWHFFFAWILVINGLVYLVWGFASGHFRRDLLPTREQLRGIGKSIIEHALLRRPRGAEAKRYNVLQKLTYLIVIFVFLPTMVLAGLSMSPGMNAIAPGLLDLFGGRQSARTIHFLTASLIVIFFAIHIFEVLVAGAVNEVRSMITGWFEVEPEEER